MVDDPIHRTHHTRTLPCKGNEQDEFNRSALSEQQQVTSVAAQSSSSGTNLLHTSLPKTSHGDHRTPPLKTTNTNLITDGLQGTHK